MKNKINYHNLAAECRILAMVKRDYRKVFDYLENEPDALYHLTVGELTAYCKEGLEKKEITQKDLVILKKNIEKKVLEKINSDLIEEIFIK